MSDFDNWVMEHYEKQEESMIDVGEKKPRLTLEEGQALLKVLLKEVKYGPVSVDKLSNKKVIFSLTRFFGSILR